MFNFYFLRGSCGPHRTLQRAAVRRPLHNTDLNQSKYSKSQHTINNQNKTAKFRHTLASGYTTNTASIISAPKHVITTYNPAYRTQNNISDNNKLSMRLWDFEGFKSQGLRASLCCRKISDSIFWLHCFTPR